MQKRRESIAAFLFVGIGTFSFAADGLIAGMPVLTWPENNLWERACSR
jgi:hypothetical protein